MLQIPAARLLPGEVYTDRQKRLEITLEMGESDSSNGFPFLRCAPVNCTNLSRIQYKATVAEGLISCFSMVYSENNT